MLHSSSRRWLSCKDWSCNCSCSSRASLASSISCNLPSSALTELCTLELAFSCSLTHSSEMDDCLKEGKSVFEALSTKEESWHLFLPRG